MFLDGSPVAQALGELEPLFQDIAGWESIKAAIQASMKAGKQVIAQQLAKGRDPTEVCLGGIAQYTRAEIVYGEGNFMYRGVLSMKGAQLLSAYRVAMKELHRLGYVDAENLRSRDDELREVIKSMG